MLINNEWRKQNPINDILEPYETLLWIGRPNEEIYVRGNRAGRGLVNVCVWSFLIGVVAITGLIFGDAFQRLACVITLILIPLWDYIILALNNYKLADWYAFSEKRLFLVTCWDAADNDVAVFPTGLSNLRDVSVRKSKKAPREAEGIGTLVCAFRREIPKLSKKQFAFELIDNPAEVQALLLDAKAACVV